VVANHKVVSHDEWLAARKEHLAKEKEFTWLRDQLSQQRCDLPWERVEKEYIFEAGERKKSLSQLFAGRSQLIVYHFMFHPSWNEGCPSCSFWADNFNGIIVHLNHRDVTMVALSKAPIEKLEDYKKRMGWTFKWVSSLDTDFNCDYQVSFTPEEMQKGEMVYNYTASKFPVEEAPGISVFYLDNNGGIFHSRGLDMLNGAYHYLDLVPKGRDEDALSYPMAWLRRYDTYDKSL